jgi:hypothetical protein
MFLYLLPAAHGWQGLKGRGYQQGLLALGDCSGPIGTHGNLKPHILGEADFFSPA